MRVTTVDFDRMAPALSQMIRIFIFIQVRLIELLWNSISLRVISHLVFVWSIPNYYNRTGKLWPHISFIPYLHHLVPWPSSFLVNFQAVAEHSLGNVHWARGCVLGLSFGWGYNIHKGCTFHSVLNLCCDILYYCWFYLTFPLHADAVALFGHLWVSYFMIWHWYLCFQHF